MKHLTSMNRAFQDQIFALARQRDWDQVRAMGSRLSPAELAPRTYVGDTIRDSRGNTLLHLALCQGEGVPILEELLLYCDPNSENTAGCTPLSTFFLNQARYDHEQRIEVLLLLLRCGANPMYMSGANRCDLHSTYGWTPFAFAVFNKVDDAIFQILKGAGCSFSYVRRMYHEDKGHVL